MKILVTGAMGFIGKNLCARLKNIRDGKDRTHPWLRIEKIYEWSRNTTEEEKRQYISDADFVFHLAGVNRPKEEREYVSGNAGFTRELLKQLEQAKNTCPVMLSSSIQASLWGRYQDSCYGKTKLESEQAVRQYAFAHGVNAYIYRFPNVFGKWCRPNYNSVVATFCHNIANDLPIQIHNRDTELELLYIDDLVDEMLRALEGKENRCRYDGIVPVPDPNGEFCFVPVTHKITLGELADLLSAFSLQPETLLMADQPENSLAKKLYAAYLSYLPERKVAFPLKSNTDERGSFTELLKTRACGQISVNISKPGITKGQHWHDTKWEFFIVVSGHGLIQERKIDSDEILEFEVSGEKIEAVHMLPGYTHNIINLSKTDDLVTVMWANESFDPGHPDTYYEEV